MPGRPGLSSIVSTDQFKALVAGGLGEEALSALHGCPALAVDLSDPDPATLPALPASLPCVLVGVAPGAALGGAARACQEAFDVLVTDAPAPPRPWVGADDLEATLGALLAAVGRSPLPAVALAQLLRMSAGAGVAEGLVAESFLYSALQAGPGFTRWLAGRPAHPEHPDRGDPVVVERRRDVLSVELNRPAVRNALNQAMRDRLVEVFQLAVADPSVRSLEVSGRGPCFSSGGDLFEFGTAPDPVTAHVARTTRSPASWLARCAGSASFFVHGACRGAGVELATFARRVTADPAATFALPELSMGLVPGAGGTVSIPRRIGRHRFAYLALTGAVIDAPLAHDWGLVDEVTGAHDGALPAPADPAGC